MGRRVAHPDERTLLPMEAHLSTVMQAAERLPAVSVSLMEASGCVLVEDVRAPEDVPAFETSAMDGFAVRATDAIGDLRLVGDVEMGRKPSVHVGFGEAASVPTGGAIPEGANAVAPVEVCEVVDGRVTVRVPVSTRENVRPRGEDVRVGEVVVPAGRRLGAAELGALASIGLEQVCVYPRVRVGVISTGDELVRPGAPRRGAEIFDANAFTLAGAVGEIGGIPVDGGVVRDDPGDLLATLDRLASKVDVYVCSGGVSMGVRDPVKLALAGSGVSFVEIAMQPGKPQAFGRWRDKPFFGVPGNTVSALVSFEMFVRPALLAMMGRSDVRPIVEATLEADIEGLARKLRLARVCVRREPGGWIGSPVGGHRSNLLTSLVRANGLAMIPPGEGVLRGATCRVVVYREEL